MEGQTLAPPSRPRAPAPYEDDPQHTGIRTAIEGEEKHHDDQKPAVLTKMKQKVKRMKEKITGKKIDDHSHDHDHDQDSDSEEEEEEEEEEGFKAGDGQLNHEVHGAPTYQVGSAAKPVSNKVSFGDSTGPTAEDPAAPHSSNPPPREGEEIGTSPVIKEFESMKVSDQPKPESQSDLVGSTGSSDQQNKTYTEKLVPIATVPADQPKPKPESESDLVGSTGSSDQQNKTHTEKLVPIPTVPADQPKPKPESESDLVGSTGSSDQQNKTYTEKLVPIATVPADQPKPESESESDLVGSTGSSDQQNKTYTEKLVPIATEPADQPKPESESESNLVGSTGSSDQQNKTYTEKLVSIATVPAEYGKQMASTIYNKISGMMPENPMRKENNMETSGEVNQDKGVSVTEFISEKLKPGEEDEALSEVISGAMQNKKEEMAGANVMAVGAQARDGGVGAVEKIRETVTSVVGGGGKQSDPNRASDTQSKVDDKFNENSPN